MVGFSLIITCTLNVYISVNRRSLSWLFYESCVAAVMLSDVITKLRCDCIAVHDCSWAEMTRRHLILFMIHSYFYISDKSRIENCGNTTSILVIRSVIFISFRFFLFLPTFHSVSREWIVAIACCSERLTPVLHVRRRRKLIRDVLLLCQCCTRRELCVVLNARWWCAMSNTSTLWNVLVAFFDPLSRTFIHRLRKQRNRLYVLSYSK